MRKFIFLAVLLVCPLLVLAQGVTDQEFIDYLLKSLGGLKGLSTLGVVALFVQTVIMFMKTPFFGSTFKNFTGGKKLLMVLGLTLVSGVLALVNIEHLSWGAALIHSTTLTALMVFANELWKNLKGAPAK